ncbi:MAG: response regulator [Elusimicrobiota bacterium]
MPNRNRIVVVDADAGVLDHLTVMLEEAGFRVTTATDTGQGFIQAAVLKPVLMILDLRLACVNGEAVLLRHLRSAYRLQSMPIIVLTTLDPLKVVGIVPLDPLIQVMLKPPQRERLLGAIRTLLPAIPDMR